MPVYEYQCEKCRRVASFLVRNIARHTAPACPHCGHPATRRVFSRFAALSGGSAKGSAEDARPGAGGAPDLPDLGGMDENDPRALGRMMRHMAAETGEAMPPEVEEMTRRLEAGDDPEKIGEELGEDGPAGAGGDDTLYEA